MTWEVRGTLCEVGQQEQGAEQVGARASTDALDQEMAAEVEEKSEDRKKSRKMKRTRYACRARKRGESQLNSRAQ